MLKRFPSYRQLDSMDCGPACLKIIAKHYGRYIDLQLLRDRCGMTREGVSFNDLSVAAESIGLRSLAVKPTFEELKDRVPLPCIAHWQGKHFVVVYKFTANRVYVSDPATGLVSYSVADFKKNWLPEGKERGVIMTFDPQPGFKEDSMKPKKGNRFGRFYKYLAPYKKSFLQLILIMLLITGAQAAIPFITKSIIDIGVSRQDLNFITLMFLGHLILLLSTLASNGVRNWILLHVSSRLNIQMISDYLIKLMKLPLLYFENRQMGDILQRANDHERIQNFIINSSVTILFSVLTFIVFSVILIIFNIYIFLIFLAGTTLFVIWVLLFQRVRRLLDIKYFELAADNRSQWIETLSTMPDIKLNNYDKKKRWRWEGIQAGLYKVNLKLLQANQSQDLGGQFITSLTTIGLTFYAARGVVMGDMTLGMLISIQYIMGQLNGPLLQIVPFVRAAQFAKISFIRLDEIHHQKDEENEANLSNVLLPKDKSIHLKNVSFKYSPNDAPVLTNINVSIPEGKVTAIVGHSGSGKTTFLKLLMGLYPPSYGDLTVGGTHLGNINFREWRDRIGAVLQEGKIFSDTILNNIVLEDDHIDYDKLDMAVDTANIRKSIEKLPMGFYTKMGELGRGLSQGQKQRILIARALYKNPEYLFFDEATNALDAHNERQIIENLETVFAGKTVVVAAHRLSTIVKADQILVLAGGNLVEMGTHESLLRQKGYYSRLVGHQMAMERHDAAHQAAAQGQQAPMDLSQLPPEARNMINQLQAAGGAPNGNGQPTTYQLEAPKDGQSGGKETPKPLNSQLAKQQQNGQGTPPTEPGKPDAPNNTNNQEGGNQ